MKIQLCGGIELNARQLYIQEHTFRELLQSQ